MNDAMGMPQTAVVVGGTSDIARAILRALAVRRLRHVVLVGRDEIGLAAAAKELHALGTPDVDVLTLDVTDVARVTEVVGDASTRLGQVDMVLVAAGVLGDQASVEADPDAVARTFATNVSGPAAVMTAFAAVLRRQGHGKMVVLSSVAGVRVRRSNYVYGASKAGLDAFAQGMAEALRGSGASLMIVRPGWVATRDDRRARPRSVRHDGRRRGGRRGGRPGALDTGGVVTAAPATRVRRDATRARRAVAHAAGLSSGAGAGAPADQTRRRIRRGAGR